MLFQLSEHSSPGERGRGGTRGRGHLVQGPEVVAGMGYGVCHARCGMSGMGHGGREGTWWGWDVVSPVEWDVWNGTQRQGGDGVSHKEGGGREGTRVPTGRVTPGEGSEGGQGPARLRWVPVSRSPFSPWRR